MEILEDARKEIDEVDAEMLRLFERRMQTVAAVAAYKQEHGLPVLDSSREDAVVAKNLARLQNAKLSGYYVDFMRHLMSVSRSFQTELLGQNTVAYQGAEGGFGHHVSTVLYPHASMVGVATFAAVFDTVQNGQAAFGIVPFENSTTGDVSGVLDLLHTHDVFIAGMADLPVTQNLLVLPGTQLQDIKTVVSHVQALEQCGRFLKSLGVQQQPALNTALAAKQVSEGRDSSVAAIASLEAGSLYGLVPLVQDISTEMDNTTRFLLISRQPSHEGDRFSLLFTLDNTVGQLARVIEVIAAEGFNMESIKSRPIPKNPWQYYFYAEIAGMPETNTIDSLLNGMQQVCHSVRMLGVYRRQSLSAGGTI